MNSSMVDPTLVSYLKEKGLRLISQNSSVELRITFTVLARPGAKAEKLEILPSGELKVSFRERPVAGAANDALITLLSEKFGPPQSQIHLLKGTSSKAKTMLVVYRFRPEKDELYYLQMLRSFLD